MKLTNEVSGFSIEGKSYKPGDIFDVPENQYVPYIMTLVDEPKETEKKTPPKEEDKKPMPDLPVLPGIPEKLPASEEGKEETEATTTTPKRRGPKKR